MSRVTPEPSAADVITIAPSSVDTMRPSTEVAQDMLVGAVEEIYAASNDGDYLPPTLAALIKRADQEGLPLIYIGLGSMLGVLFQACPLFTTCVHYSHNDAYVHTIRYNCSSNPLCSMTRCIVII